MDRPQLSSGYDGIVLIHRIVKMERRRHILNTKCETVAMFLFQLEGRDLC